MSSNDLFNNIFKGSIVILILLCILAAIVKTPANNANAAISSRFPPGRFQIANIEINTTFVVLNTETGGFEIFIYRGMGRSDRPEKIMSREYEYDPANPRYIDHSKLRNNH